MTIIAHGHSMLRFIRQWCASSLWLCALAARADFQGSTHLTPFDEDTIAYGKTKSEGPVAKLARDVVRGS